MPRLAEQAIDPQTNRISRAFPVQTKTVPVSDANLAQTRQALTNVTQTPRVRRGQFLPVQK